MQHKIWAYRITCNFQLSVTVKLIIVLIVKKKLRAQVFVGVKDSHKHVNEIHQHFMNSFFSKNKLLWAGFLHLHFVMLGKILILKKPFIKYCWNWLQKTRARVPYHSGRKPLLTRITIPIPEPPIQSSLTNLEHTYLRNGPRWKWATNQFHKRSKEW